MSEAPLDELLRQAEIQLSHSPVAAVAILERAADDTSHPSDHRVEALALLAQHIASARSAHGLTEARSYLSRAEALRPQGPVARGRLLLSRGYIAFREAQDDAALALLQEAADLLAERPRLRARAFDTLGMLLSRRGDLDGAHELFSAAVELKCGDPAGKDPHSLALTYGNLGRLELTRGRFAEAERWLRQDLELILLHDPKPATEAHVRSQLAQAIEGQCPGREADMRAELDRAHRLAPRNSITALYILKNVALLALREDRPRDARKAIDELRETTAKQRFAEFDPWLPFLEGRLLRAEGSRHSLDLAARRFEESYQLFAARQMPQQACDAALDWADALAARGDTRKAASTLQTARDTLDAPPSVRDALVARLDTRLVALGGEGFLPALQTRLRRLLGTPASPGPAASSSEVNKDLPSPVTFCALEIRGLDALWAQDRPADWLLTRVGRIFHAQALTASTMGATVDRLGPDRLLIFFPGGGASGRAIEAIRRIEARTRELSEEQAHQREPPLALAAGVSVGWARRHEVQTGASAERGWWGPAVTRACQLAAQAETGEILLDQAAQEAAPETLRPQLQARGGATYRLVEPQPREG
jgi:tetratricopeptide (TPR) repeat protein